MIYVTNLKKRKELNIPKEKCLIIGEYPAWPSDFSYASIFLPGISTREAIKNKTITKDQFEQEYLATLNIILNTYTKSDIEWLNNHCLVEQEGTNPDFRFRHLLAQAISQKFNVQVQEATKDNISSLLA